MAKRYGCLPSQIAQLSSDEFALCLAAAETGLDAERERER